MPIYEFKCLNCEKQFEIMLKFNDDFPKNCPDCGGIIKKLISNTSFILKGTGWYVTDYASPNRNKEEGAEKPSDAKQPASNGNGNKKDNKTESQSKEEVKTV